MQSFIFMLKFKKNHCYSLFRKVRKKMEPLTIIFLSIIKPCHWSSTLSENISLKYTNNCKTQQTFVIIAQYQSSLFCWRGGGEGGSYNLESKILKREGSEKNECLGGLNESLPLIFACRGLIMFLAKKDFIKNNFQLSILTCFSQTTN